MIVSGFINELRRRVGDLPAKHLDSRQGDGSSTVYKSTFSPIDSKFYQLYINSVLKTPGTDYTIDLDTGDFTLATTTSNLIELKYQSVNFPDQWWLDTIKDSIRSLGDRYFRTVIRSTSGMALSAGVNVYDCPSACIRLIEAYQSDSNSLSGNWVGLGMNHWYDRRSNKLILGAKPIRSNPMAISFLRRISLPTATSSTLDVEENWLAVIGKRCEENYARARAMKIAQQGNASVEQGHLSVQTLRMLANDANTLYETLKKQNRPIMPAQTIAYYVPGGGDVQRA